MLHVQPHGGRRPPRDCRPTSPAGLLSGQLVEIKVRCIRPSALLTAFFFSLLFFVPSTLILPPLDGQGAHVSPGDQEGPKGALATHMPLCH